MSTLAISSAILATLAAMLAAITALTVPTHRQIRQTHLRHLTRLRLASASSHRVRRTFPTWADSQEPTLSAKVSLTPPKSEARIERGSATARRVRSLV